MNKATKTTITKKTNPKAGKVDNISKLEQQIVADRRTLSEIWQQLRIGTTTNYRQIRTLRRRIATNLTKIRQFELIQDKEDKING